MRNVCITSPLNSVYSELGAEQQFRNILEQTRSALTPWERATRQDLEKAAVQMDDSCVGAAIHYLNDLSSQRARIDADTPWDGDAIDAIHFQQEEVARLLELSKQLSCSAIAAGLKSECADTRFWVANVLSKIGDKTVLPLLFNAKNDENITLNIEMMDEAISSCSRSSILRKFKKFIS